MFTQDELEYVAGQLGLRVMAMRAKGNELHVILRTASLEPVKPAAIEVSSGTSTARVPRAC